MQNDRITVETIEQKVFRQKGRGYDPDEVDAFLDSICDEMITLLDEIDNLNHQIVQLQAQAPTKLRPNQPQAPVETPKPRPITDEDTETIKKMLINAQKLSDQTIREAREQAETITEEARTEAEKKLGGIEQEHERLQKEIETLKQAAKDYRDRFNRLLEDQKHIISAEKELFV